MDNFNLDNFQKKMPYKVPEKFFEEMQANVLKKTTPQKVVTPKIFKINFPTISSLAAALVIVFGLAFLWKVNQSQFSSPSSNVDTVFAKNNLPTSLSKNDVTANSDLQNKLSQTEKPSMAEIEKQPSVKEDKNYEQLLNSLTDQDLEELSKNSDQDIYLELYN